MLWRSSHNIYVRACARFLLSYTLYLGSDRGLDLAVDTTEVVNEACPSVDKVCKSNPADYVQRGFSFPTVGGKDGRFTPTKTDRREVFKV